MIRKLDKTEYALAASLALEVYIQCGAEDFDEEGLNSFKSFISNEQLMNELVIYGAFEDKNLVGISLASTSVRDISFPPIVFCKETMRSKRKSTNRFPSISSTLSDSARNPTSAGSFPIPIRVLAFPTILSLIPLNWEIPCRYTFFKGHVSRNCPPVCRSITNGTSGLLLAGRNMMNYPIRKTC